MSRKNTKKSARNPQEGSIQSECGLVVRSTGSNYVVRMPDGSLRDCRIKGNFRIKGIRTTNPVAVGDNVEVVAGAEDSDYITAILPRRNYIIRRASNLSKESHILAANIDRTLLVATLREPVTGTVFIDRFLATAEAYSIPAMLVLNKCDLWDEDDAALADAIKYLYDSLGYTTVFTSTITGEGIDTLRSVLKDSTTLVAGNSGVGKSSLINALVPGANLRTSAISDIHHTGMHTTTFSEMLTLPGGGSIIDIPGVKGFGTIDFEETEVSHFFPEIFAKGRECKYSNCLHLDEPGCAVRAALDNHDIAESRYNSYLSVLEDARGGDKYRKPY